MPAPPSAFVWWGGQAVLCTLKKRLALQKARILGRRSPGKDIFSKNGLQIAAGFVIIF
jgi:hypothetical protein